VTRRIHTRELVAALVVIAASNGAHAQQLDVIEFSSAYYSALENSGSVAIEIQRSGRMTDYASFTLRTAPQSAVSNDFRSLAQTITLAPGESNVMVSLEIFNDALAEGYEVFEVLLSDPDPFCCQLGPIARATIGIQDNDVGVYFGTYAYYVYENVGELQLEVFRVGDMTNMPGSITFEIEERSAKQDIDFTIPTNRVSFLAGQTNAVISVLILNDALIGSAEQFILKFEPNPDPSCCSLGYPRTAEVWINDNDRGVEFSAYSRNVREDAGVIELVLERGGELIAEEGYVTVKVFTNGLPAAAIPDLDFASPANFLVYFAAGQTNASFSIALLNDTLVEDQEKFGLSILGDASTLTLGGYQTNTYVYIDDNDFGVEFVPPFYITREGEHPGQPILIEISVQRVGDPTNEFSVDLELGGTATAGADFILPTNRLFFPSGQSNVVAFVLPIVDDPFVEGDEYITLSLTNATGEVPLGRLSACRIHIYDNEYPSTTGDPSEPSLWFSTNKLYSVENGTNASVAVLRGGDSSATLTVDFSAAGDATPGLDFVPASGTLTFQPLEVSKTIVFRPLADCRIETNETARIALINPSAGAAISEPDNATLLIVDNDAPGSLDEGFIIPFLAGAVALQPDGKIVIGGSAGFARLNKDGSQHSSFALAESICAWSGSYYYGYLACDVYSVAIQPDSKIVAGGYGSVIRLEANGVRDTNFSVSVWYYCSGFGCSDHGPSFWPASVASVLLQPDGKVIIQGSFNDTGNGLARLNRDSTLDTDFTANARVLGWFGTGAALQADGKLVIGAFLQGNRFAPRTNSLVRLNPDGTQDTNFPIVRLNGPDSYSTVFVSASAILPDQRILIGGRFAEVNNQLRPALARINSDGSLDTDFNPVVILEGSTLAYAHALTIAQDGNILVAGQFDDGTVRVAKLDPEGSLIPTFNSGLRFSSQSYYGPRINSIIEQPDGEVLVAGTFDNVNGIPRPGIARLKSERSHIHLSPPSVQPDGSLRIVTGSHVGGTYVLQSSTDLGAWTDVSTNIATDCALAFEDPNPASNRFYRVMKFSP
jgi:uncharacterized delta-60 repeat protein